MCVCMCMWHVHVRVHVHVHVHEATCFHGDAEGREARGAHHVELLVGERHPVRAAAPRGLRELLVERVRARPAEEAGVALLLVDQASRRLDVLQA